ncbi:MAG TPA: methylmalonyl-CoA mutase family protein [Mycobacteriales bacterium]|nr:methylmalonyl-CoA mutase family protein [Mycobacteriales bacterium]
MPAGEELALAADFPTATRDQWLKLVAKVVGVDDPAAAEVALSTTLFDDVRTLPLYVAGADVDAGLPGQGSFVRGRSGRDSLGGWDVRVRHDHPDPKTTNEQILEDLEGGATSIWLELGPSGIALDALPAALAEVYFDLIAVALDAGPSFAQAAEQFLAVAADRGRKPAELSVRFGADPIGCEAASGVIGDLEAAAALAVRSARELPDARALTVDALPFHLAGADDAQEIGCSLAVGAAYLRAMREAGLSADEAFGEIEFRYAATADQFLTIAKLRAARGAWAQVAASCGVTSTAAGQLQHAVSSPAMLTRRDPWNNILRGALACFAAGVGGAAAVTVAPFDAAIGYSDRLARRIARNTHALLIEESNVARTVDPAGGSWYVEQLTRDVARSAWSAFQEIERTGGVLEALRNGSLGDRLAQRRTEHLAALADHRATITGVTEFPLEGEVLLTREPRPAPPTGGLPRVRWAEEFEDGLDRADEAAS